MLAMQAHLRPERGHEIPHSRSRAHDFLLHVAAVLLNVCQLDVWDVLARLILDR